MSQDRIFEPALQTVERALVTSGDYENMYAESLADNDAFWGEHGKRIDWIKPYSEISDVSYDVADLHIRWFADGTLNAAANCLDRHLETRGNQIAIIWEGDDPSESRHITYAELHAEVCKFANVLKAEGAKKGDRITICLLYTSPSPRDATLSRMPSSA